MMKKLFLVLTLGVFVSSAACGDSTTTPTNEAPVVTSTTATPPSVVDSETSSVIVAATDADGDTLTYAWTATGGTLSGSAETVTYTPDPVTESTVQTVAVTVSDGNGGSANGTVDVTVTPTPPTIVNAGENTEWIAVLVKTNPAGGNPVVSPIGPVIQQSDTDTSVLSGSNQDQQSGTPYDLVTEGSVDGFGNVTLVVTATQGGSDRFVLTFTGMISGSPTDQTISGTYVAEGPSVPVAPESGTFTMTHN